MNKNSSATVVSFSSAARRLAGHRSWNLLELNQLIAFLHGQEILHTAAARAIEHITEALTLGSENQDPSLVFGAIEYFRRRLQNSDHATGNSHTVELRLPGSSAQKLIVRACEIDLILPPVEKETTASQYLQALKRAGNYVERCKVEHDLLKQEVQNLLSIVTTSKFSSAHDIQGSLVSDLEANPTQALNAHTLSAERCFALCDISQDTLERHAKAGATRSRSANLGERHLKVVH
jgi:hypothetical protein